LIDFYVTIAANPDQLFVEAAPPWKKWLIDKFNGETMQ